MERSICSMCHELKIHPRFNDFFGVLIMAFDVDVFCYECSILGILAKNSVKLRYRSEVL